MNVSAVYLLLLIRRSAYCTKTVELELKKVTTVVIFYSYCIRCCLGRGYAFPLALMFP